MLIAVGSTNPGKVASAKKIINKIWPTAEIVSVKVSSGVKEQPLTDEEAITGAINRARNALNIAHADFGIGAEGNVHPSKHGLLCSGWYAAIDKKGQESISSSCHFLLPDKFAKEIEKGGELGPIMDKFLQVEKSNHREGALGYVTNNMLDRREAAEQGILLALAPFYNKDAYK